MLKDSSKTNCDCIAICQSHDQIEWFDSIGYSGLVDESYVHSCKRFTDLNSIDWIKVVSTGPERNHFVIKSGIPLMSKSRGRVPSIAIDTCPTCPTVLGDVCALIVDELDLPPEGSRPRSIMEINNIACSDNTS